MIRKLSQEVKNIDENSIDCADIKKNIAILTRTVHSSNNKIQIVHPGWNSTNSIQRQNVIEINFRRPCGVFI